MILRPALIGSARELGFRSMYQTWMNDQVVKLSAADNSNMTYSRDNTRLAEGSQDDMKQPQLLSLDLKPLNGGQAQLQTLKMYGRKALRGYKVTCIHLLSGINTLLPKAISRCTNSQVTMRDSNNHSRNERKKGHGNQYVKKKLTQSARQSM